MFISWIIPLYNCHDFINQCINSLLDQNIPEEDFEIIVVNDGSTDGGEKLVEDYIKLHKNISLINQPNNGVGEARNTGFKQAQGEFVHFVDADDVLFEESIMPIFVDYKRGRFIEKEIISIGHRNIYQNTGIGKKYNDSYRIRDVTVYEYCLKKGITPSIWEFLFRRSFLIQKEIFFGSLILGEDQMFLLSVYEHHNAKMCMAEKIVYGYFQREGSAVNNHTSSHVKKTFECLCSISDYVHKSEIVKIYPQEVVSHYMLTYVECLAFTAVLSASFSLKELKQMFEKGYRAHLLPIKDSRSFYVRILSFLSDKPIATWLSSFLYRKIYVPFIRKRRSNK